MRSVTLFVPSDVRYHQPVSLTGRPYRTPRTVPDRVRPDVVPGAVLGSSEESLRPTPVRHVRCPPYLVHVTGWLVGLSSPGEGGTVCVQSGPTPATPPVWLSSGPSMPRTNHAGAKHKWDIAGSGVLFVGAPEGGTSGSPPVGRPSDLVLPESRVSRPVAVVSGVSWTYGIGVPVPSSVGRCPDPVTLPGRHDLHVYVVGVPTRPRRENPSSTPVVGHGSSPTVRVGGNRPSPSPGPDSLSLLLSSLVSY